MAPDRTGAREPNLDENHLAYLIVRDGQKWRDVFRLMPGQITTVGRAPNNRVVLRDEICSRDHCELYFDGKRWILRDLGSRNGTSINGRRVSGEWPLENGQLIQIGSCLLGFAYDLSQSFPEFEEPDVIESRTVTAAGMSVLDSPFGADEPDILHRRRKTRFQPGGLAAGLGRDPTSHELAKLYRLAIEMGAAKDLSQLANVVMDSLFSRTCADAGAILLLPTVEETEPAPEQLESYAVRSLSEHPYQVISEFLVENVLTHPEAVLARDVADDSRLASRDSLGEIHAKSVICAPIRFEQNVYGAIHLYTSNPETPLEPDDLEYTLAVADQLAVALENLNERESLADGIARIQDENETLRRQLEIDSELVGESPAMQELRETIARIAPTDATTLVRGESGVGKELVARAIHFNSGRRGGPLVCMNCAALAENLLESELFGHEKGSFTGATERKIGKFEQADTGTLFLDEVGEMDLGIQAKFLRVLEGHTFERIGGRTPITVDVRVVAATNRDLQKAVEEGIFRSDLYFRLFVVDVPVTPLRQRRSDIPILAKYFLDRFAEKTGRRVGRFSDAAMKKLEAYDWPGNVRELQNTVERAVILCTDEIVQPEGIQLSGLGAAQVEEVVPASPDEYRAVTLEQLEQEHILQTLEETKWNKSQAAQILGIERSTLDRKLKRYQVNRPNKQ